MQGYLADRYRNRKFHAPRDDGFGGLHGLVARAGGNNRGGGGKAKRLNHFCIGLWV